MTDSRYYESLADRLERAFAAHRIQARVWDPIVLTPGFARFKFTVGANVLMAKVTGLHEEIAYNLGVTSTRIYRIDGEYFCEIPRADKDRGVKLVDQVRALANVPPNTALLGLQPDGVPLLVTLGTPDVPHGLLAGTTGSGKTALLRTMLASLALWNPPGRLQLALIDPKDRGLAPFAPLPHVWRGYGVVSDPAAAANVLEALVVEMERRDRAGRSLPLLVVAIDEFADLLDAGGKVIGELVQRLTQRGREAGLFSLVATQRPAATLVGSMLKANLPLRLVGKVMSPEDAKIATGRAQTGAERLLGRGDFFMVLMGTPARFQAAYAERYELDGLIALAARRTDEAGQPRKKRSWSDLPYQLPEALPRPAPAALPAGLGQGYVGDAARRDGEMGMGNGNGAGESNPPRDAAVTNAGEAAPTSLPHFPIPTTVAPRNGAFHRGARRRPAQGEGSRLRDRYSVGERLAALAAADGNRTLASKMLYKYCDTTTLKLMAEAIACQQAADQPAAAIHPPAAENPEENAQ